MARIDALGFLVSVASKITRKYIPVWKDPFIRFVLADSSLESCSDEYSGSRDPEAIPWRTESPKTTEEYYWKDSVINY